APPAAPAAAPAPAAPRPAKVAGDAQKKAVTGRVLDADGKPVAGARVAAFAVLNFGRLSVQYQEKALDSVKTDAEGRFLLPLPDAAGMRFDRIHLLAGAKGYGPAWRNLFNGRPEVELRLPPEQAVVGRLFDLQGQPVANAKLRPVRVLAPAAKPA